MAGNYAGNHTLLVMKELFMKNVGPPKWNLVILQMGSFVRENSLLGRDKEGNLVETNTRRYNDDAV